jgi:hypothetical protein
MSQRAGSLLSFGPGVTERISKLAIGFGSWRASLKSWQARQRAAVQRRLAHKLAMTCWREGWLVREWVWCDVSVAGCPWSWC